jgi:hypothetical protein
VVQHALDARSRMLYHGDRVYLNGENVTPDGVGKNDLALLRQLADRRRLPPRTVLPATLRRLLHSWYVYGFVHLDSGV